MSANATMMMRRRRGAASRTPPSAATESSGSRACRAARPFERSTHAAIPVHAPKNSVTARAETSSTARYSPRKNIAKLIPEYSVMKPATRSCSDS